MPGPQEKRTVPKLPASEAMPKAAPTDSQSLAARSEVLKKRLLNSEMCNNPKARLTPVGEPSRVQLTPVSEAIESGGARLMEAPASSSVPPFKHRGGLVATAPSRPPAPPGASAGAPPARPPGTGAALEAAPSLTPATSHVTLRSRQDKAVPSPPPGSWTPGTRGGTGLSMAGQGSPPMQPHRATLRQQPQSQMLPPQTLTQQPPQQPPQQSRAHPPSQVQAHPPQSRMQPPVPQAAASGGSDAGGLRSGAAGAHALAPAQAPSTQTLAASASAAAPAAGRGGETIGSSPSASASGAGPAAAPAAAPAGTAAVAGVRRALGGGEAAAEAARPRKMPRLANGERDAWLAEFDRLHSFLKAEFPECVVQTAPGATPPRFTEARFRELEDYLKKVKAELAKI
eukprot:TRINITY_DN17006_c0_g1_i1.p1 TRINITY_DN17006_c0_g1~~TRINITY_DN17006_c0_g1_i1.p1  ORF type:complete len:399 (-),score=84.53 TRINITY_DN17006_c0_g1_i1:89-1285(-)